MQACIHRGSHEIGGSCVELQSEGQRLLIDMGLPLEALGDSTQYVPMIDGLDGSDPSLLGVLVSHPHIDHYGLLGHLSPKVHVGMGAAARRIVRAASPFMKKELPFIAEGWNYESGVSFDIGPFRVTPFLVDHSAYDAYSLLVESEGRRLFYSGDFRSLGRKGGLFGKFCANPPLNIHALLLEGTTIGRLEPKVSETMVENRMARLFSRTPGLVMVHSSMQNIDRVVSVFKACRKTSRILIVDLYGAAVLEATGNRNIPQAFWPEMAVYVPRWQLSQARKLSELLERLSKNRISLSRISSDPGRFALMFRPMHMTDLESGQCLAGAAFVYSMWEGYRERGDYARVDRWLEKNEVFLHSIHSSGHAGTGDLQKLVSALNPQKVIPIHSFSPERYREVFPSVEMHDDGEWWEV